MFPNKIRWEIDKVMQNERKMVTLIKEQIIQQVPQQPKFGNMVKSYKKLKKQIKTQLAEVKTCKSEQLGKRHRMKLKTNKFKTEKRRKKTSTSSSSDPTEAHLFQRSGDVKSVLL